MLFFFIYGFRKGEKQTTWQKDNMEYLRAIKKKKDIFY